MSFPWENSLAVIELLSLICSSDLIRGTLSTCLSDTPIMGSGHVLLYTLDTVPTADFVVISLETFLSSYTMEHLLQISCEAVCIFWQSMCNVHLFCCYNMWLFISEDISCYYNFVFDCLKPNHLSKYLLLYISNCYEFP